MLPIELYYGRENRDDERFYQLRLLPSIIGTATTKGTQVTLLVTPWHFGPGYQPQPNELERAASTSFVRISNSEYLHPELSRERVDYLKERLASTNLPRPYRAIYDIRYPTTPPYAHSLASRLDMISKLDIDPVDLPSLVTPDYPDSWNPLPEKTKAAVERVNAYRKAFVSGKAAKIADQLELKVDGLLSFAREFGQPTSIGSGYDLESIPERFPGATLVVGIADQTDVDRIRWLPTNKNLRFTPLVSNDFELIYNQSLRPTFDPTRWKTAAFQSEEIK